jgi:signal transduction histidine kinase
VESVKPLRVILQRIFAKPASHLSLLSIAASIVFATGFVAVRTEYASIESRNWLLHSYDIRQRISELEIARAEARSAALAYLVEHKQSEKDRLDEQINIAKHAVQNIREMVQDNPFQSGRAEKLQLLIDQQSDLLQQCLQKPAFTVSDFGTDPLQEMHDRKSEIGTITSAMDDNEESLVRLRLQTWNKLFWRNLIVIGIALIVALLLVLYSFRQLKSEIAARKELEHLARVNAESFRALSARILELQDIERRKIARELHDSVGQYLAGLKMSLSQLSSSQTPPSGAASSWLLETIDLTDRALSEIRTISHLLHPPLLDELGFESSAKWYVEEFAKRSNTKVNLEIGGIVDRLPRGIELALFRVLQESLTNVHRHAGAQSVDVQVTCADGKVILQVADNGTGIPPQVLQQFRAGSAAGIGLSGMRERLIELRGTLEVQSSPTGTTIKATLPTTQCESDDDLSFSVFTVRN